MLLGPAGDPQRHWPPARHRHAHADRLRRRSNLLCSSRCPNSCISVKLCRAPESCFFKNHRASLVVQREAQNRTLFGDLPLAVVAVALKHQQATRFEGGAVAVEIITVGQRKAIDVPREPPLEYRAQPDRAAKIEQPLPGQVRRAKPDRSRVGAPLAQSAVSKRADNSGFWLASVRNWGYEPWLRHGPWRPEEQRAASKRPPACAIG